MKLIELKDIAIQPEIRILLEYATSANKVDCEYWKYIQSHDRKLFGWKDKGVLIACIGIAFMDVNKCEIKHIAVLPQSRGLGIGSKMIQFIKEKYNFDSIIAETDRDAVEFYRSYGFDIVSLGEKYPSVERFRCEYQT